MHRIAEGDFAGARDALLEANPLASSLARVCYRYCERSCPVGKKGDPVAVRHLKRAALDLAGPAPPWPAPEVLHDQRVAVVGGGPAGLMAAWVLGRLGYPVTVLEATDLLGGLMTSTIPGYRLPDEVFQEDLDRFRDLPVEFRFHTALGGDADLDRLTAEYDAVLLGIGTHRARGLGIPGERMDGVHLGLPFL